MKIFDVIYQLEALQCLVTEQALESQFLIGVGEHFTPALIVDVGCEGLEEIMLNPVSFQMMRLEVRISEVVITEVAGSQPVSLSSVFDQELAAGEVLPALLTAEHAVLLLVVLLLLLLLAEDLVAELTVK